MLGQKVAQLVNEQKATGIYTIDFNANQLSSGTYIYRLETREHSITKKMVLIK